MANFADYLTIENIVVVILAIIGLVWLINSLRKNWKITQIKKWPQINASVINAMVEPEKVSKLFGSNYLDPRNIGLTDDVRTKYIPRILYRYVLNGREYQSNNVTYGGDKAYNSLDIKTLMSNIQPGSTIQVFYNPNNPNEAYILNGTVNYFGALLGLALIAIAVAIGYHHNVIKNKKIPATSMSDLSPSFSETTTTPATIIKKLRLGSMVSMKKPLVY